MGSNLFEKGFVIKQYDTLPALSVRLKTRGCLNEVIPFCLSGVSAVTFSMVDNCGNLAVSSSAAQITSSTGGTIQYNWIDGDTVESGKYKGEFEMFFNGGKKMTVPTIGGLDIQIIEDINKF